MKKVLIVVDMQNDFIDGALGTPEAQAIVPNVVKKIKDNECGRCLFLNYFMTSKSIKLTLFSINLRFLTFVLVLIIPA